MEKPTTYYFSRLGYWLAKILGPDWRIIWKAPKVRIGEILKHINEDEIRLVLEWQNSSRPVRAVAFIYTIESLNPGDPRWQEVQTKFHKISAEKKIKVRFFSQAEERFQGWSLSDIIFDAETECDIAESDHGTWHLVTN